MTKYVLPASEQSVEADSKAQARLDKILQPETRRAKKESTAGPTWLTESAPTPSVPETLKRKGTKPQKKMSSASNTQSWNLAKQLAVEMITEEQAEHETISKVQQ